MMVYVDAVMGMNFIVDLLLLLGTNRVSGFPGDPGRCALAACAGAAYSGACLLPAFRFLGSSLWRLAVLVLMGMIAFGMNKSALRRIGILTILSMALGGIALSWGSGEYLPVLVCSLILWGLCRLGFGGVNTGPEYIPVTVSYQGKAMRFLALRDTGNGLRDPVTGQQVLVLSSQAASRLTGLHPDAFRKPVETLAKYPLAGLRLIPCRTVSGTGLMLAMRFSQVRIGDRQQSAVVAFAAEDFGRTEGFQALTGGVL